MMSSICKLLKLFVYSLEQSSAPVGFDSKKDKAMKRNRLGLIFALGAALAIQMAGCKGSASTPPTPSEAPVQSTGKVSVIVGDHGFVPSAVNATKGQPLTLEFKRVSDKTCATQVVFPELNITKDLPLNSPVAISIPTDQPRKLTFLCGMGMYKSSVVIQ